MIVVALLIDESAGRRIAVQLGIQTIGILGILVAAKRSAEIPAVSPLIDRLKNEAGFWVSAELRSAIIESVGES